MDNLRSITSCLARGLAALGALAFVAVTVFSVVVVFGLQPFLKADLYKQTLRQRHLYERLPALMAAQIQYSLQQQDSTRVAGIPLDLKDLSTEEWQALIGELMPADWFQRQTEGGIDQLFTFFYQPQGTLNIQVSLLEVKTRLAGDAGYRVFMQLLDRLPACDPAQWALLAQSAATLTLADVPLCRPPDELVAAGEPQIRQLLGQVAGRLPDTFPVLQSPPQSAGPSQPQSFENLRWLLVNLPFVGWGGIALAALILVAVTLLAVRSLHAWLLWWGVPLLITAILGGGGVFVVWFTYRQAAADRLISSITGLAPAWKSALASWFDALVQAPLLTTGLIFAAIGLAGLAMLALLFILPQNRPQEIYLPYR